MQAPQASVARSVLQRARNDDEDKTRQKPKPKHRRILTRILSPEQLLNLNIGTHTTRRSPGSFARNLPATLDPKGGGKNQMSRLYSYMRKFGGAGYLGFHKQTRRRPQIVRKIIDKMRLHREDTIGPEAERYKPYKFIMVSINPDLLPEGSVLDLGQQDLKERFYENYRKYRGMYKRHAKEGVVVIDGPIPRAAIVALRAFRPSRDVQTSREMRQIIREVINWEDDLPDEVLRGSRPPDDNDPPPPLGGELLVNE